MALVFQDYSRSLFPWLPSEERSSTVARRSRADRDRLVKESLEAVGLLSHIDQYPWQLSGGMQQRV
jgi:ABC-type nitrate/sulfonate/bicarbonate transport system ATPase subunit